jgi:DNA polymerase-3 subunit delta
VSQAPEFEPAYLVHGDDHGRIAERRGRLVALAGEVSGAGGVEAFDASQVVPAQVAVALSSMTFAIGRRFLVVDGCEAWKEKEVAEELAGAVASIDPETTVAFFAFEDGRRKAPASLHAAVEGAGGRVIAEVMLKQRELPRWAVGQASALGLTLDGAAAQLLVAQVGDRQQRILRELEKLALEYGAGASIGVEEVEASVAESSELAVWALVDAIVGHNPAAATRTYLELRSQGEDGARLAGLMARRVREVLTIAERLEAGVPPSEAGAGLKMSPYAARRRVAEARESDAAGLRRALEAMARLELAGRGASRLDFDTVALRTIAVVAS